MTTKERRRERRDKWRRGEIEDRDRRRSRGEMMRRNKKMRQGEENIEKRQ